MNEVEAIKDKNLLAAIPPLLLKKSGNSQFVDMWEFSLNVALRISDTLNIKFSDIENETLNIKECKTGKLATIHLNAKALEIVQRIKRENPSDIYLFQSKNSRNVLNKELKPLHRSNLSKLLNEVGKILGLKIGTHSARKTRGYWLYKKTGDIVRVMKMLRHSSVAVTMRYIGITQEEINNDFKELIL